MTSAERVEPPEPEALDSQSQQSSLGGGGEASATARSASHGAIALSAAKLYFLVVGLVQQIGLSWLLQDSYGALRGVLSPASITYNPLVTGGVQGMSRLVSQCETEEERSAAIRQGLKVHWTLAVLVAAGFFLLAPVLAASLHSDYLLPALRGLSLVVLCYGLYAPLIGVLNGQRRFVLQATFDVIAATLRTAGLFVGAWWLIGQGGIRGTEGAVWGFGASSAVTLMACLAIVGLGRSARAGRSLEAHVAFVLPVVGAQVILNFLLQVDTNTLRAFATRAAEAVGQSPQAADPLIAAYGAGQLFAFLPYQILIGLTFILFPLLSTAQARGDAAGVATYVRHGVRLSLIFTGAIVSVTSGIPHSLIALVFPPQFAEMGAASLGLLSIGLGGFALFGVFSTVLNSLGRQWVALALTAVALASVFGLNWWFVSDAPFGPELLWRTAVSTSIGVFAAMIMGGAAVYVCARALVAPLTPLRVVACAGLCIVLARQLPTFGRVGTVLVSAVIVVVYALLLVLARELSRQDLQFVRTILRKRG